MEHINLWSDLCDITKNDIRVGALKRDEFAVAVTVAVVAAIYWYFLLLPSLLLCLEFSRSFVCERSSRERAKVAEDSGLNNNNNNPLYEANDNESINPMYTDKETVKNTKWVWEGKKKINILSLSLNITKQNKKFFF